MVTRFILYACPEGVLGEQLGAYLARSAREIGRNGAHAYMPHVTLTGFFADERVAAEGYVRAVEKVLAQMRPSRPEPVVVVEEVLYTETFHGLKVASPWLARVAAEFTAVAESPTREEDIRLKDWLHVSMAYAFAPEQGAALAALGREMVDPLAEVSWSLRFYERDGAGEWMLHGRWEV